MNSLFITYNLLFSVSLYGYFITTQEKETELKSNCAFNTWFGYVWLHYICSQDSEFQISARNNTTIRFMVKNDLVFFHMRLSSVVQYGPHLRLSVVQYGPHLGLSGVVRCGLHLRLSVV